MSDTTITTNKRCYDESSDAENSDTEPESEYEVEESKETQEKILLQLKSLTHEQFKLHFNIDDVDGTEFEEFNKDPLQFIDENCSRYFYKKCPTEEIFEDVWGDLGGDLSPEDIRTLYQVYCRNHRNYEHPDTIDTFYQSNEFEDDGGKFINHYANYINEWHCGVSLGCLEETSPLKKPKINTD
jgi:hypothetical protein